MSKSKMYQINHLVSEQKLDDIIEELNASIEVMELDINEGIMDKQAIYKEKAKKLNIEEFVDFLTDLRSPDDEEE